MGVQPLAKLDLTPPQWGVAVRAYYRMDAVRSCCGLVATAAGFAAAGLGMFTSALTGWSLAATAALTLGGLASLRALKPAGHQKSAATGLYAIPGGSLAVLLITEHLMGAPNIVSATGLGLWTIGTLVLRPARVARHMVSPPPPRPAKQPAPATGSPAARWWAQHVAIDGGAAPGTALDAVESTGEGSVRALIRSTVSGRPVPDVNVRQLSALMDVPEDTIRITPEPGRGASVRRLTIGRAAADDPAAVWAQQVAPAAMPGAVLTGVRFGPAPGAEQT